MRAGCKTLQIRLCHDRTTMTVIHVNFLIPVLHKSNMKLAVNLKAAKHTFGLLFRTKRFGKGIRLHLCYRVGVGCCGASADGTCRSANQSCRYFSLLTEFCLRMRPREDRANDLTKFRELFVIYASFGLSELKWNLPARKVWYLFSSDYFDMLQFIDIEVCII